MLKVAVLFTIVNVALAIHSLDDQHLKIWGGNDTDISAHPWTVSLQNWNNSFCGGSLISSTWVLTAADCVSGINLNVTELTIRAGSSQPDQNGQLVEVSNILVNPKYNSVNMENDIALLQLKSPVTVESAKVASLPKAGEELDEGTAVNVVGWGVEKNSTGASILQLVELLVINRNACADQYTGTSVEVPDTKFCARGKDQDVCMGDFGGPVAVDNVVYGVISPGLGCEADYPAVFTKVSKYTSWINEVTEI
ncbi:unnamed protein product [Psylliodes chrysocephalus]|uniref:Peptidase S1 domain-containing protein n=1 Tax=Psylliodes chrysocephalus TaxID=3402493 RepID=A0A9P0GL41_9CUCU|nr:unnamed protein product [Psylliodes chrysocephala]